MTRHIDRRPPVAPEVPTLNEAALPGFIVTGFHLLFAPNATPAEIVARLNSETVKAVQAPVMREPLVTMGLEPVGGSSAECAKLVQADIERWGPVVRAGGARSD